MNQMKKRKKLGAAATTMECIAYTKPYRSSFLFGFVLVWFGVGKRSETHTMYPITFKRIYT